MRFRASLLAVFVLTGCAHAITPQSRRSEVISDGGTVILLRYEPGDAEVARQAQRALRIALPVAARWGPLPPRLTVTIHPTHDALETAASRRGRAWLRAWARGDSVEVQSPRTWTAGAATDAQLAQLLAHELTHCVLSHTLGDAHTAASVPLWFWEGMATTNAAERFSAVLQSSADGGPRTLTALLHGSESPLVYPTAEQAFRFLVERYGRAPIRRILTRVRDGAEFPEAFHEVLGIRVEAFEREFAHNASQERTRG